MKVGIIYSKKLKNYDFGVGHPFRGDRFEKFFSFFNTKFSNSDRIEYVLNEKLASDSDLELWHTKDYMIRIPNEKDGRQFNLLLTEKGQNLVPKVRNSWSKIQKKITRGLHESEKATLLHLLQKVEKNLNELTSQITKESEGQFF